MSKQQAEFDLTIDANRIQKQYFKDLVRYRELFFFFVWRDVIVRYKQTFLGIAWAIIRPLLNMAVFVLVFGKIASLGSDGISYPLFVLAGLLPWQLFSSSLVDSSGCLVSNVSMISKVYFPRLILPINHMMINFIDFLISLGMLFILLIVVGVGFQWTLLWLPFFIALVVLLSIGTGFWLSALTVRFRDIRFIVPFVVQFGIFIAPVGYGSFLIPESWQWIYFLNPMAGIIEGFRWALFGVYHSYLPLAVAMSMVGSVLVLVTGFNFFRKMERVFADII